MHLRHSTHCNGDMLSIRSTYISAICESSQVHIAGCDSMIIMLLLEIYTVCLLLEPCVKMGNSMVKDDLFQVDSRNSFQYD